MHLITNFLINRIEGAMLLVLLVTTACAASAKLPNFVILFVDDLGYNEINLKEMAPKSGGTF